MIKSKQYRELEKEILDITEYLEEEKVMLIPVNKYSKKPADNNWSKKTYTPEEIAKYNGNYGVKVGYNHKANNVSLAVVDIDGLKGNLKGATAEFIYECLKDLPALIVETQSGGKHLYFWNRTIRKDTHNTSKSLQYPPVEALPDTLKEVANANCKDSVEIFTKYGSKQCILPSSTILDEAIVKEIIVKNGLLNNYKVNQLKEDNPEATEEEIVELYKVTKTDFNKLTAKLIAPYKENIRSYKVISEIRTLAEIPITEDVNKLIYDTLISKGFTPAPASSRKSRRSKTVESTGATAEGKQLKNLTNLEVKLLAECFSTILAEDIEKDNFSLYLGGFLSETITRNSCNNLLNEILKNKKVAGLMKDTAHFKETVLKNYTKPATEGKAGIPYLMEALAGYNLNHINLDVLEEKIRSLCNPKVIRSRKELPAIELVNAEGSKVKAKVYGLYLNEAIYEIVLEEIAKNTSLHIGVPKEIGVFILNGKPVTSIEGMKLNNSKLSYTKGDVKIAMEMLEAEGVILSKSFMKSLETYIFTIYETYLKPPKVELVKATSNTGVDKLNYTDTFTITKGYKGNSETNTPIPYGILQNEEGIFSFNGNNTTLLANMQIGSITRKTDLLGMFIPEYTIEYYSITDKEKYTFNGTEKDFLEEMKNGAVLLDKEKASFIFNNFTVYGTNNGWIDVEKTVFKEGFFINEETGKLVENTPIKDLEYTKEDVAEGIKVLNDILRAEAIGNECNVFRFMLGMPFSYCLKQLGYGESCYGLILTGRAGANKTTSCINASRCYGKLAEENSVNTVSVYGKRLEVDTFPKLLDEAFFFYNLPEAKDSLKTAIYEKYIRSVSDLDNQNKIKTSKALSVPALLMNETLTNVRPEISRRYKILEYTVDMVVAEDEKKEFIKKYTPRSKDSELNKLKFIGRMFTDKLRPYLETKDKAKRNELVEFEKLVIKLLKEIAEEVGVEFNPNMYEIAKASSRYNFNPEEAIVRYLNKSFRKLKKDYSRLRYSNVRILEEIASDNAFSWLSIQARAEAYIISKTEFEDFINTGLNTNYTIEEILEYLNLPEKEYETNSKFNKNFTVNGKTVSGIKINNSWILLRYFFNLDVNEMLEETEADKEATTIEEGRTEEKLV